MDMKDTDSKKRRKPYQTPKLTQIGKLSEVDYELLATLGDKSQVSSPNLQQNRKVTLALLVQCRLLDSDIDQDGRTRYTITEFGRQVVHLKRAN